MDISKGELATIASGGQAPGTSSTLTPTARGIKPVVGEGSASFALLLTD
jgi:hypothetical protein